MPSKKLPPVYGDLDCYLDYCCGVKEIGNFSLERDAWHDKQLLTQIEKQGIGYFVSSFVKGHVESVWAQRRLRKDHTLVFSTPYVPNMSRWAGKDINGDRNKVKLCVFKYGKGK